MAPKPRLPKFNFDNNYKTEYISHSDGSRDEIFIPPYIWQGRLDNTKKNTKHTGKMYQFVKKLGKSCFVKDQVLYFIHQKKKNNWKKKFNNLKQKVLIQKI